MGIVYAAEDPTLQRSVALKILRSERLGANEGRARMIREGRAMAKLDHPGVLRVFEVGELDAQVYVVMELAEGGTLGDWLGRAPRSIDATLDRFLEAGSGLAAAHEHGLVHRDFKPHNVFVRADGRACVGDFSLARVLEAEGDPTEPGHWNLGDEALPERTRSAFAGTPGYMAPEQITGGVVDARADQFAFCVTLHEAVYGGRPEQRPASTARAVPRALRAVIERGLQPSPSARFADMSALLSRLEAVRYRGRRRIRLAGGVLVVGALAGLALSRNAAAPAVQPCTGAPERLATAWSGTHAAGIQQAFEATRVADATVTAERASARLDDYGRRWVDEYRERCEDTRIRGLWSEPQFSMAVDCLEEQRGSLGALVERLSSADASTVERALASVVTLADPRRCGDLDRLQARAETRPPAGDAEAVAALRAELQGVRAEFLTGHASSVAGQAAAVDAQAAVLGHAPLRADAGLLLGRLERALQRHEDAAQHLEASYFSAVRSKDFERACKAAAELVDVYGVWLGRAEQSELWREHAAVALEVGPSPQCTTGLGLAEANVLTNRGEYADALDGLERLEVPLEDHTTRLQVAAIRSDALTHLGRTQESEAVLRAAITEASDVLGPSHPEVGRLRMALGVAMGQGGDEAAAREQLRLSLEIFEASVAADDRRIAQVLGNLAQSMTGEPEAARKHLLRALDIYRKHPETMRTRGMFILQGLGAVAYELDDYVEAERYFAQAVDLLTEIRGPNHPMTAAIRGNVAAAQLEQGRFEDARANYEAALAGTRESVGEGHPEFLRLLGQLKSLHVRAGDEGAAAAVAEEITRVAAAQPAPQTAAPPP